MLEQTEFLKFLEYWLLMHLYNRTVEYFSSDDSDTRELHSESNGASDDEDPLPPLRRNPFMATKRFQDIMGAFNQPRKSARFGNADLNYFESTPLLWSESLYEAIREFSTDCSALARCKGSFLSADDDKIGRRSDTACDINVKKMVHGQVPYFIVSVTPSLPLFCPSTSKRLESRMNIAQNVVLITFQVILCRRGLLLQCQI